MNRLHIQKKKFSNGIIILKIVTKMAHAHLVSLCRSWCYRSGSWCYWSKHSGARFMNSSAQWWWFPRPLYLWAYIRSQFTTITHTYNSMWWKIYQSLLDFDIAGFQAFPACYRVIIYLLVLNENSEWDVCVCEFLPFLLLLYSLSFFSLFLFLLLSLPH